MKFVLSAPRSLCITVVWSSWCSNMHLKNSSISHKTVDLKVTAVQLMIFVIICQMFQSVRGLGATAGWREVSSGALGQVSPGADAVWPGTEETAETGTSFTRKGDFYLGGLFDIRLDFGGLCHDVNPRGLQWMYAMVYAVELINARKDLLPNITLGFHIKDTCSNANTAVTSSLDFITSSASLGSCGNTSAVDTTGNGLGRLVAVVGPATSTAALSIASLFGLFKLPEISYSATSELLSEKRYSYFTRVVPSDIYQATALADIVRHFGWSVVATISSDDLAYGQVGLDRFLVLAKERNICVAYKNKVGSGSRKEELLGIVRDLRKLPNVKVIVGFAYESAMLRLLDVFSDQNATSYTWVGTDAWTGSPALTADGRIGRVTRGMLGLRYSTREVDGFAEFLKSLSPVNLGYQNVFFTEYWEKTFGCYFSGVQVASRGGTKRCNGREVFPENDAFFSGRFVSTILDSVEVVCRALHTALKCNEARCDSDWDSINGEDMLGFMKGVNFIGNSGYRIELTEGGDLGSGATYDVFNVKPVGLCSRELIVEKVGIWNQIEGFSVQANMSWSSDDPRVHGMVPASFCSVPCRPGQRRLAMSVSECCWECVDCLDNHFSDHEDALTCSNCSSEEVANKNRTACVELPDVHFEFRSSLGVVVMTLSFPGIVLCVTFGAIFVRRRHTQVVVRACNGHAHLVLFGALLCFIFSWTPFLPVSDVTCVLRTIFQLLPVDLLQGFLALTAFVAKRGRQCVTTRKRAFIIFSVFSLFCVFTSIQFADRIPGGSRVPDRLAGFVYVDCQIGGIIAVFVSLTLCVFLDAIGLTMAYHTRSSEENFKEGKFVFFALIVHIMIWVTTVGVYCVLEGGRHFQTFILSVGISFTGYVPLFVIFVPKLYLMKTKSSANENVDARARRKIRGKSRVRRKRRKPTLTADVFAARQALLSNCQKALNAITEEKTRSVRSVELCKERIEELKERHQRRLETKKSLLKDISTRKIYTIVTSSSLQSTQL